MVGLDKNKFSLQLNYCKKYCKNFCVCNIAPNVSLFRVLPAKVQQNMILSQRKKYSFIFIFYNSIVTQRNVHSRCFLWKD